ncbi:MAG: UV DNA damage repair endonuclease UvsE [Promethearchaeota archaeon]
MITKITQIILKSPMKLGYACINQSLKCRSSNTFRLKNYSEERLINIIDGNLSCLFKILEFNKLHHIFFFRITSDLIPFASHSIMNYNWQDHFKPVFKDLGKFVKLNKMRITMHPGQYTVLNSVNPKVYNNSINELRYHVEVLDLMNLNSSAKVQIHIGGVYGDKEKSKKRFISRFEKLDDYIKKRVIIENDDRSYTFKDCLSIHDAINIPIVFDVYHHECNNNGEILKECFNLFTNTWKKEDGLPIVHYSSEHPIKGKCSHTDTIDINHFKNFIKETRHYNFDIMLEIKDKEKSALKTLKVLANDQRLNKNN